MEEKENLWILHFKECSIDNERYLGKQMVAQDGFRFFIPDKNGLIPPKEGEYECDKNIYYRPLFISQGAEYYTIRIIRKHQELKRQIVINKVEMTREDGGEIYKITITETTDGTARTIHVHTSSQEKRRDIIGALNKKGRKFIFEGSNIKLISHTQFDFIKMICAEVL